MFAGLSTKTNKHIKQPSVDFNDTFQLIPSLSCYSDVQKFVEHHACAIFMKHEEGK